MAFNFYESTKNPNSLLAFQSPASPKKKLFSIVHCILWVFEKETSNLINIHIWLSKKHVHCYSIGQCFNLIDTSSWRLRIHYAAVLTHTCPLRITMLISTLIHSWQRYCFKRADAERDPPAGKMRSSRQSFKVNERKTRDNPMDRKWILIPTTSTL